MHGARGHGFIRFMSPGFLIGFILIVLCLAALAGWFLIEAGWFLTERILHYFGF